MWSGLVNRLQIHSLFNSREKRMHPFQVFMWEEESGNKVDSRTYCNLLIVHPSLQAFSFFSLIVLFVIGVLSAYGLLRK